MMEADERRPRRRGRRWQSNMAPWLRETLEWVKALAIALAVTLLLRAFVVDFVRVEGPSMEPNLLTGERLMVNRFIYRFKDPVRGQIVICTFPDAPGLYVKRVIGLPGETIQVQDGVCYVDGQPLNEPYIKETMLEDFAAYTVPEDTVFVMGDNRNDSMDSRKPYVGPIPERDIRGPAVAIIWPLNRLAWLSVPQYD